MPPIHYGLAFLTDPAWYTLLVLGCVAMVPRAGYTAAKMSAVSRSASQSITPNLAQRICLFIPGFCVFGCIGLLGYVSGALTLLVAFLTIYIVMVLTLKRSGGT
jgi:hypothetical protein